MKSATTIAIRDGLQEIITFIKAREEATSHRPQLVFVPAK